MSVSTGADEALKALEGELARHPYMASGEAGGEPSLYLSERIEQVRRLLVGEEPRWISVAEARRLLGFDSEEAVNTWIQLGFLRSRTQPDDGVQVSLDDVLSDREAAESLTAFGGRDMAKEEMEAEYQARPGTLPWERESAQKAQ